MKVAVPKLLNCALSHRFTGTFYKTPANPSIFNSTTTRPQLPHPLLSCRQLSYRMASSTSEPPKWSAQTVRSTYLDYFKKNGHTFGKVDLIYDLWAHVADQHSQCRPLL